MIRFSLVIYLLAGFLAAAIGATSASALVPEPAEPRDVTRAASPASSLTPFGLFGSLELKTKGFSPLLDWKSVLAQVEKERPLYGFCGGSDDTLCSPRIRKWRQEIARLRPLSPRKQIRQLNKFANNIVRYATDKAVHGVQDHWASPIQFLQQSGDCEDYATLKFFSLLELGFSNNAVRVAVVRDRKRKILHAVVTVQIDGETLVLDNLFDHPVAHHHMLSYVPVYSFNLETQWAHIVTDRIRAQFINGIVSDLSKRQSPTKHQALGTL